MADARIICPPPRPPLRHASLGTMKGHSILLFGGSSPERFALTQQLSDSIVFFFFFSSLLLTQVTSSRNWRTRMSRAGARVGRTAGWDSTRQTTSRSYSESESKRRTEHTHTHTQQFLTCPPHPRQELVIVLWHREGQNSVSLLPPPPTSVICPSLPLLDFCFVRWVVVPGKKTQAVPIFHTQLMTVGEFFFFVLLQKKNHFFLFPPCSEKKKTIIIRGRKKKGYYKQSATSPCGIKKTY